MNEHLKARLKDTQARIAELEQQLAESQRIVQQHRLWAQQLRTGWPWRIVSGLRRLTGAVRSAATPPVAAAPAPPPPLDTSGDGPAAGLLATLPTVARINAHGSGESKGRLIDLAASLIPVMGRDMIALLRAEASTSAQLQFAAHDTPAQVAVLCSSPLARELAFEAGVTPIHQATWREQLTPDRFAFVLLESVASVDGREWNQALTADGAARTDVERMLEHCKAIRLPVVLWFRESAGNYARYAWLADFVDRVYMADPLLLPRIATDFPGRKVASMPPAVQPAIYNPLLPPSLLAAATQGRKNVLLDMRSRHAIEKLDMPLSATLGDKLIVADSRVDAGNDEGVGIPTDAAGHTLGRLNAIDRIGVGRLIGAELFPADAMDRGSDAELRQLQAAASGSVPVGPRIMPGLGVEASTGGASEDAWLAATTAMLADPLQRARCAHHALRTVLSKHCMADRLQVIADDLQLSLRFAAPPPRVACLLVTRRPQLLPACIERFWQDVYLHKELIVVVHGDPIDRDVARSLARRGEPIRFFHMGSQHRLGACLNFAFSQTTADYWCKWDDDDFYGPNYLSDFMLYRRIIDFDLAGKPMAFTLLDETDELLWDPGWFARRNLLRTCTDTRNTGVSGATLFGHRRVLEATPFPEHCERGTDTEFLKRCHEQGWNLLSTDPFNFVRYRSEQEGFHTWQLGRDEIVARTLRIGQRADIAELAFL